MQRQVVLVGFLLLACLRAVAGEGMWMLDRLSARTRQLMQEMGLELPFEQLYNPHGAPCLQQAVVSFGGFCSGVVVSPEGLLLTNHHCGFDAIRQHSTVEHDYLTDGFVALSRSEELPNPDLFVSFLLRTEDVTPRVVSAFTPSMSEAERQLAADSVMSLIREEGLAADSLLRYSVSPYYGGSMYFLSVYKDYTDVRLVFAPPSSVGKFGWDTDNWMWPRHTGDFSVFRIYAGPDNEPAPYAPENVPYHPSFYASVSLDGYREGTFCMTLGYPGHTERYLSSYGVDERVETDNAARMAVRGLKQDIWKQAMESDPHVAIQYASKYASSSNYWKNSIGVNRAVRELDILGRRRTLESRVREWIRQSPDERRPYLYVFTELEMAYRNRRPAARARSFFEECFLNGLELVQLALALMNFDAGDTPDRVRQAVEELKQRYADFNAVVDRDVLVAMLDVYRTEADSRYLPEVYQEIDETYGGSVERYADWLYAHSALVTSAALDRVAAGDSCFSLFDDPAASLALDLLVTYFDLNQAIEASALTVGRNERLLGEAVRSLEATSDWYPDANSTLRISFGIVGGYSPADGVRYDYYTTTEGILEKELAHLGDADFRLQPALRQLFQTKQYGRYANGEGDMNVCFLSDNDITGGNSGSGMFNGSGELIGLAFDGNWEGMGGDFQFEPSRQRCIGVDVRYILYIIEAHGQASHLLRELGL